MFGTAVRSPVSNKCANLYMLCLDERESLIDWDNVKMMTESLTRLADS